MKPPRWLLKLFGPPRGRHAFGARAAVPEASGAARTAAPAVLEADPGSHRPADDNDPPVRLIFADGTVGSFPAGSDEERRARYLASHLLARR